MKVLTLTGILMMLAIPSGVMADDAPPHECDALAAADADPERRGPGVPYEQIDFVKAIASCTAALEERPDTPRFRFQLGRALNAAREFKKAAENYEAAAAKGYAAAQNNLALLYAEGEGVPKDKGRSIEWLKKASDADNPVAQASLGKMYLTGEAPIEKNQKLGLELLKKASGRGYAYADQILRTTAEACYIDDNGDAPLRLSLPDLFVDLDKHVGKSVIIEGASISAAGNSGAMMQSGSLSFVLDGPSMEKETFRYLLKACSSFMPDNDGKCAKTIKVRPSADRQNITGFPILSCAIIHESRSQSR